jgi:TfoX/Sxy family transcriptional regulator of competence genes
MAFDEYLVERIRQGFDIRQVAFRELKMMGGLCFMVDDKMCIGVVKDQLMARIDPNEEKSALALEGAKPMNLTGKPMRGYVFVNPEGYDFEEDLDRWIDMCLDFNPKAKRS